jgi:hypothetical protein
LRLRRVAEASFAFIVGALASSTSITECREAPSRPLSLHQHEQQSTALTASTADGFAAVATHCDGGRCADAPGMQFQAPSAVTLAQGGREVKKLSA